MTLQEWVDNGWLKPHTTSPQEIDDLLRMVDRDAHDAGSAISADWRFGIAYNAALKLCTVLLYASGYRPARTEAHFRTLQAIPLILGPARKADADYLETCRRKRNSVEYDRVGGATDSDVEELAAFVTELRAAVVPWLKRNRPDLLPASDAT